MEKYIEASLCYNALELGVIKLEDLLCYLITNPVTDDTLIAYRHAILKVPGDQHYYQGVHFLCRAPVEYGAIYSMSNGPITIRPTLTGEEVEVGMFVYKGILLMQQNTAFARKIRIITDQNYIGIYTSDELKISIRARSQKPIDVFDGGIENIDRFLTTLFFFMVLGDWLERLEKYYQPKNFIESLMMCRNKKEKMPEYWEKISPRYERFFKKVFEFSNLLLDKTLLGYITSLFPTFFPDHTKGFSEKAWYIYSLPLHLQGYFLGYPIHMRNPSREELDHKLVVLSRIGVEKYAQEYEEQHKNFYNLTIADNFGFIKTSPSWINEKDTLEESVFSYSALDTIAFDVDNKRYFFTRPEFQHLAKGVNHWTNTDNKIEDMGLLTIRQALVMLYNLPKSAPIKDLLDNVEKYFPAHKVTPSI